jgi:hypothetical protein
MDKCFSLHRFATVDNFLFLLKYASIPIAMLFIYLLIVFGYFFFKTSNKRDEDSDSLARVATISLFDFSLFKEWVELIYEFIQLLSFSFSNSFKFINFISEIDAPILSYLPYLAEITNVLSLVPVGSYLPYLSFFLFFVMVISVFIWLFVFKKELSSFLNEIILETLFIPAMRSFFSIFGCHYSCSHFGQPSTFIPYAPMAIDSSVSCWSFFHIGLSFCAGVAIAIMFPLAINYLAFEKNKTDPAMRMLPRFNVFLVVCKVCFFL